MHKLTIKHLRPGMIVAQGIYHTNGLFLLTKGTRLTDEYIQRLRDLHITSLYVTSSDISLEIQPPPDIIKEKTRLEAIKNIFDIFRSYQLRYQVDTKLLGSTVALIIDDLADSSSKLVQISDIRVHDSYTFSHSVNVAVLAAMLGKQLNFSQRVLQDLTMGALLHDIGKTKVARSILNKPTSLSPADWGIISQHPTYGYNILASTNDFSSSVLKICLEHHEKFNGAGYPGGLKGEQISQFARIVAVADVYDALTSERAYKKAYLPYLAYKLMKKCSTGHFDNALLDLFFEKVAIYPVGTILKLSTGYAIVKKVPLNHSHCPVVLQFADNDRKILDKPFAISLYENRQITIERELIENEIIHLLKQINIDPAIFIADVMN